MAPLLTFEEALREILARVRPLPVETVPLAEAAGRVLAQDATSAVDLPPFPSSAMDGFAVRVDDPPGRLPVVDRSAAGRDRSSRRTASCSPPHSHLLVQKSRRTNRLRTTRRTTVLHSSVGSLPTYWSPPEASRSVRTISSERSKRSSVSRKSSGRSP